MDAQFAERRRYPRVQTEWLLSINRDQGEVQGITLNVSAGGATVRFQDPPLVHEVFEITIKIPEVDRLVVAEAQVVWSTADITDNELTLPIVGISFTNISEQDRRLISTAVSKALRNEKRVPTRVVSARKTLERILYQCMEGDL